MAPRPARHRAVWPPRLPVPLLPVPLLPVPLLAVPLLAGLLATVPAGGGARATPFQPAGDDTVIEYLPSAGDPAAQLRRDLHRRLAATPDDLQLAVQVARLDIDRSRAAGDPRYDGYAETALAPWFGQADPPEQVRLLRAVLRQSRHDFAAALADLDHLLDRQPGLTAARLVRASVHQVQGDFTAADRDCLALPRRGTLTLAAVICHDAVLALTGQAIPAVADLTARLGALPAGAGDPDGIGRWGLTILAETAARLDQPDAAEPHYRRALALAPDDPYLLGSYADFLLDRQRPAEVLPLLADRTRIDPLLLRLALAERQLNLPAAADHIADLADRFATARRRGDTIHRREEARFTLHLLHQPERALRLAIDNWQVQREPADARLVLETALAAAAADHADADQTGAALAVADWLDRNRLQDRPLTGLATALRQTAASKGITP